MQTIIEAQNLRRSFGDLNAVDGVDLSVSSGNVIGLIGPNGAGKTTLLKALLGLTHCDGDLSVLGYSPMADRGLMMEEVCFIADTAVLPRWMRVGDLLDYVTGTHRRFNRDQAEAFLASTDVEQNRRVGDLSKGMTVQLHLAIVMAIDARLLILDEPTLGLDILFRKRFYEQLINDYFDGERTILVSTHQVEEVQNILTHVMFMHHGKLILHESLMDIEDRFQELHALGDAAQRAEDLPYIGKRNILGGKAFIFEGASAGELAGLGELRTPSVSDLFVAKVGG
ncbi:ABC transporter ATP-binding protein [Congregibacter litoralis]|uniref:ABC-type multidrug transport system, ATPase component n=1 Tax=Congregibacter litoralis KT71 TaxID=314285 RepID=A4A457_9GAMM|nr:ABC transporter ATP-binding protein [Congregibacter litoralis]EAQ99480.1 ABC-type multidrug transport system, ATPase component [Congregibacter litoralis KT71]